MLPYGDTVSSTGIEDQTWKPVYPGRLDCPRSGQGTVALVGGETFYQRGVSLEYGADRCSNEIMEDGAELDDLLTVSLCPGRVSIQACTLYHTGSAAC